MTTTFNTAFTHPDRRQLWERSLIGDATLDAELLASLWHPHGSFQIGAMPQVRGREAIRGFFEQFFSMGLFARLEHKMIEFWDLGRRPDLLGNRRLHAGRRQQAARPVPEYRQV